MKNLNDIFIWKKSFGFLSIHEKPDFSINRYVLLNGGYGDFSLDIGNNILSQDDYFSKS